MKLEFLKEEQIEFLREGNYLIGDETPKQRFEAILGVVKKYESQYSEGLTERMREWMDKNYYSCSTPTLSNAGRPKGQGSTPLPASCNIISVGNSIQGIYGALGEAAMLSKLGAGVGVSYSGVCDKGTQLEEGFYSNSKLDWIEDIVNAGRKVSQGASRRGYVTPFLSILDPDFDDLMARIDKKNPDKKDPLINNTVGIKFPEGFFRDLPTNNEYKRRYIKFLEARKATGKVYASFEENMNKNNSPVYAKLGLKTTETNICTEYIQPFLQDMTSVCVVGALNLVHWDEIKKNPQIIKDAFMFLDILNEEYILLTEGIPFMEKARKAAMDKRDIGLGTLGFHEYLQSKMLAYGDPATRILNKQIYSTIRKYGEEVTREMGEKLGSPRLCKEAGMVRRNASLMMIAPNKSTSFISGNTSLGIEPFMSNIFFKSLAKIQSVKKNKHLEILLEEKGKNTRDVWRGIEDNNGSVQHLDFLTLDEKNVFKTFSEISPKDIIDLASDRQEYIDMGQSLNLVFRKNYTMQDLIEIHKYAFDKGIKTLYYAYPSAHAVLEKEGEKWDTCSSCAD